MFLRVFEVSEVVLLKIFEGLYMVFVFLNVFEASYLVFVCL